ncbi:hypothetical protein RRG08_017659 [Elysia crispata]|uniref:Uncharacterized protein n=1 Tax=Elysia crispata TaxID=231223 RepID=A0AAE0ZBE8_9GAST|nr:hypothetical protein RRG08_017659 [Elysia crispata]
MKRHIKVKTDGRASPVGTKPLMRLKESDNGEVRANLEESLGPRGQGKNLDQNDIKQTRIRTQELSEISPYAFSQKMQDNPSIGPC